MKKNIILLSDMYKETHHLQYPRGTEIVYSYAESRGGKFKYVVPVGLQAFLIDYLAGEVVEQWMIEEAEQFLTLGFGYNLFNREGWQRIVDVHGGKLPLLIKASPEGLPVANHNVLLTIENTDEKLPWLTNFVETMLLRALWYPTTVCTVSHNIKALISKFCSMTGCEILPYHLNDFGARGVSSHESAKIGGMAHLVNFTGTDTIEGIVGAMEWYDADVCGHSVIAAEHSTITAYGKENEAQAYRTILENADKKANGAFCVVSLVSDSYDLDNAVINIFGKELKDYILARNGKLVVRPDSGDPAEVTVRTLRNLWTVFGGTYNKAGYRELNPKVGIIYGDGIDYDAINSILFSAKLAGFAANNIIFGMGGALLQHPNRDTQKFALKLSYVMIDGQGYARNKQPKTDPGKASKAGRLKLVWNEAAHGKQLITVLESDPRKDELVTVFYNGDMTAHYSFKRLRKNAATKTLDQTYN